MNITDLFVEDRFSFDPALMEAEGLQGELVYDHKMLWRANLYIDEGGEDWNDLHPWDSDENEWNVTVNTANYVSNRRDFDDVSHRSWYVVRLLGSVE